MDITIAIKTVSIPDLLPVLLQLKADMDANHIYARINVVAKLI